MKTLTLSISLFLSFISFTQSKYNFDIGLDTMAFNHKVRSKTKIILRIDSTKTDTTYSYIHNYNQEGYCISYEEIDHINMKKSTMTSHNKVLFIYNTQNYLIDEKYSSWGGPIDGFHYPSDTTITTTCTKTTRFKGVTFRKEVTSIRKTKGKFPSAPITTISEYDRNGKLSKVIHNHFTKTYTYYPNGLIKSIKKEYNKADYSKEEIYNYTYFP